MFGNPKENSLWVEKYRPKNLDSYVGNENLKKKVSRYLKEGDVPHLLLFGNAGTGKTTLAKIIANGLDAVLDGFQILLKSSRSNFATICPRVPL